MHTTEYGFPARNSLAAWLFAFTCGAGLASAQDTPPAMEADFVFIYDNSGSMWSHSAKIDSTGKDTTFYPSNSCGGARTLPGRPFTYITATGPRTIELVPDSTQCREYAGDPYQARTRVIAQAIDYLVARYPNTTAGAIAFAHSTSNQRPPLALSVPGNADSVKASLAMDSVPATNYIPPLQLAVSWLADSSLTHAPRKGIVFISDGQPSDGAALTSWLPAHTSIPIHTLALGDSNAIFTRMEDLSARTDGRFYRVDPRNIPLMNQAIRQLIDVIALRPLASIGRSDIPSPPPLRSANVSGSFPDVPWVFRMRGRVYDLRGRMGFPTR